MSLLNRIAGIGDPETVPKLPVHTFWAAMYELSKGKVTQAQIISFFGLDAGEQDELTWLVNKYTGQPTAAKKAEFIELMHVIFMLAEAKVPGYSSNADITARINAI